MTQVHVVHNKKFWLSFYGDRLNQYNFAENMVEGRCQDAKFILGPHRTYWCDYSKIKASVDFSTLTLESENMNIYIKANKVYDWIKGPRHRLDVEVKPKKIIPAHGLLGQGLFEQRTGRIDLYPSRGEYTTQAWGEGAIDGNGADYEMKSAFATDFKFSQYKFTS